MPKTNPISLSVLQDALKSPDRSVRRRAVFDFSKSPVTADAIPALREALKDEDPDVVSFAAVSIGKLGPVAASAVRDLMVAACRPSPSALIPQSYCECIEALVKIDPHEEELLDLIQSHIGISNWYFLKASLEALKTIGTPEALDLLKRAITFWLPDLDKKEQRIVKEIAAGKR